MTKEKNNESCQFRIKDSQIQIVILNPGEKTKHKKDKSQNLKTKEIGTRKK
jgi:hypothetical protein